ncbi:MAG: glycosyltransferase [Flavobacteriales bacterium]
MDQEKVLVITYYWPPSGGSGVQRWMYFCKYLPENGIMPYVITVDPKKASYKVEDESFSEHVKHIPVFVTSTFEPLKLYSRITTGSSSEGIPQGFAGEKKPGFLKRMARYIRGNWFIPDARKGWNKFALKKAEEIIRKEGITKIITTGPPHSSHLIGLALKKKYNVKWIADFRDPWLELYYNQYLYRSKKSVSHDADLEKRVLEHCDAVITVGPSLVKLLKAKIPAAAAKVSFILNGFDDETMSAIHDNPPTEKFIISHIGVLGETQPITSLLATLKSLESEKKITPSETEMHITGNVSPSILEEIKTICPWLTVVVKKYVPHTEALRQMKKSHLLLNSQPEIGESTYMISGKLMEYLASGNPVLVLGNPAGDAAGMLNEFKYCRVFDRKNEAGIKEHIYSVYTCWKEGKDARHPVDNLFFSRRNNTVQLAEIIKRLS